MKLTSAFRTLLIRFIHIILLLASHVCLKPYTLSHTPAALKSNLKTLHCRQTLKNGEKYRSYLVTCTFYSVK